MNKCRLSHLFATQKSRYINQLRKVAANKRVLQRASTGYIFAMYLYGNIQKWSKLLIIRESRFYVPPRLVFFKVNKVVKVELPALPQFPAYNQTALL